MSDTETEQASCSLSLRVTPELNRAVERDAAALGISKSAAARLRLRTGHVPSLNQPERDHG